MRAVYTEREIPASGELRIALGSIVTPSARDRARERGVEIVEVPPEQARPPAPPSKTVAIGSDHGGFAMKQALLPLLDELGLAIRDIGVFDEKPVDYPDIAQAVAGLVASGEAARGVIIDGAGIGSSMAANKVHGVRAALCYDLASARNSREHNDANVLTLGGRLLTHSQAEGVLRTWLATPFAGGRHQARVDKIMKLPRALKGEGLNIPELVCPDCTGRCPQTCHKKTKEIFAAGANRVSASEKLTKIDASIAALIDHTILKPEATAAEIDKVCEEARKYSFASVCIHPYWVTKATALLAGSPVKVCTVVGFPLGANTTGIKRAEAEAAIRDGAREIDMVINVGALKSGDHERVRSDIAAVVEASHAARAIVKVIIETALLTDDEKAIACTMAKLAKADFVKTSTGFSKHGATVHDVALMRSIVGPSMGVKASGGVRTLEDAKAMAAAGATRIGASASVKIVESAATAGSGY